MISFRFLYAVAGLSAPLLPFSPRFTVRLKINSHRLFRTFSFHSAFLFASLFRSFLLGPATDFRSKPLSQFSSSFFSIFILVQFFHFFSFFKFSLFFLSSFLILFFSPVELRALGVQFCNTFFSGWVVYSLKKKVQKSMPNKVSNNLDLKMKKDDPNLNLTRTVRTRSFFCL